LPLHREEKVVRFLIRTGLATSVIAVALALISVSWTEYSARTSCAGAGSSVAPTHAARGGSASLIDEVMPGYHIGEKHSIFIEAPPERVFDSLKGVGSYERPVVRLFGLVPAVTGNRGSFFSEGKSMYEELRSGPDLVLEEPNREVVVADVGTADERASSTPDTAREFAAYQLGRNEMKGAVNLRVDPERGGSRLTTETLMAYGDRASCRNFGRYWGVIYPGSSLLRIELLKTIKNRVESSADSASLPENRKEYPETATDGGTA
jgi:hypothetical protein